jgi:alpha-glucoside transport system permease protein
VPAGSVQARQPAPKEGAVTGVVWRDFKPGGGTPGKLERGEVGLPNVTVQLRDSSGKTIGTTTTAPNGNFVFTGVKPGAYRTAIGSDTFRQPYGGVAWLGAKLINPAVMIAYIWVWAGFSMVVIAAGLAHSRTSSKRRAPAARPSGRCSAAHVPLPRPSSASSSSRC